MNSSRIILCTPYGINSSKLLEYLELDNFNENVEIISVETTRDEMKMLKGYKDGELVWPMFCDFGYEISLSLLPINNANAHVIMTSDESHFVDNDLLEHVLFNQTINDQNEGFTSQNYSLINPSTLLSYFIIASKTPGNHLITCFYNNDNKKEWEYNIDRINNHILFYQYLKDNSLKLN